MGSGKGRGLQEGERHHNWEAEDWGAISQKTNSCLNSASEGGGSKERRDHGSRERRAPGEGQAEEAGDREAGAAVEREDPESQDGGAWRPVR